MLRFNEKDYPTLKGYGAVTYDSFVSRKRMSWCCCEVRCKTFLRCKVVLVRRTIKVEAKVTKRIDTKLEALHGSDRSSCRYTVVGENSQGIEEVQSEICVNKNSVGEIAMLGRINGIEGVNRNLKANINKIPAMAVVTLEFSQPEEEGARSIFTFFNSSGNLLIAICSL